MRRVRVRRVRRREKTGLSLIRVRSRSLPQMSMSQVAREWDRLSKAEKERRRSLLISRVYGGDASAFYRDLEARPRYIGRALLHIDKIIGAEAKPEAPSKPRKVEKPRQAPKRETKPKTKIKSKAQPQKKVEKPKPKPKKAEAPPVEEFEAEFDKAFREALERKVKLYKPGLEGNLHYDAPNFEMEYADNWTEETVLSWAAEDLDAFKEERLQRYREMTAENPEAARYFFKRVNMWADKIAGDMARKTRDQMLREARIREEHLKRQRGGAKPGTRGLVGGYKVGDVIRLKDYPRRLFRVVGPAGSGGLTVETLGVKDSRMTVYPDAEEISRVASLPEGADAYGYVYDIRPGHTGYVVSIRTDRGEFYRNLPTKEQAVKWAMKGRDTIEKMNYETGKREPRDVAWVPVTPPPELPPHLKKFKNKRLFTVRVRDEPIYSEGRWVFPSDSGDRAAWALEQLEQMHSEGQKALAERRERAKQSRTLERPRKAKDRRDWDRTVIPYTVLGEFANDRDAPYAHIKVEGGEVEVKGMDPSHVTLYRFRFPDPGLIPEGEYAIEETSTYYSSPLKHPTKVEWDAPDQTLRFKKGSYDAWFKLAPPETVGTEVPQPRLYYKARFRMMLKPLLKLARNAADDLANMKVEVIKTDPRGKPTVKFSWTTRDAMGRESSVEEMFEAGAGPDYQLISAEFLEGDDHVKAVYAPRYLVDFLERAKRMGLEAVTFEFNEDNPLHIEAGDAELEAEFWQAPMIGVE